jgi:hypothetical protein
LEGHYKLNFDTAIRDHFSVQAAVCRDHQGAIVKAVSQISPPCTLGYGEAQGALLAASLASQLQLSHFVIEGDSLIVISGLLFPAIISDWHIEHLIHDTLALLSPTSKWEAKKINRSANFYAHHVATCPRQEFTRAAFLPSPLSPLHLLSAVALVHLMYFSPLEGLYMFSCV